MSTLLTVIGTRPQYLKFAAIAAHDPLPFNNVLLDTGQHYDTALSEQFIREYALPRPAATLDAGGMDGSKRLASLLTQLDPLMRKYRPDAVLCFGDTDSTLAAALAATRLSLPLIHVEAGERSRDMHGSRIHPASAPEEGNRVTVDHLSSLLLCATEEAVDNLDAELAGGDAVFTGDIMFDLYLRAITDLPALQSLRQKYALPSGEYALSTVHRAINTDNPARLTSLIDTLTDLPLPVFLPLHPRTEVRLKEAGISSSQGSLHLLPPLAHHELLALLRGARHVLTDSGGLTREACFSGVPSICLDDATAWHQLCESGWCTITGSDPQRIREALELPLPTESAVTLFGDGMAAVRTIEEIRTALP
ncbi:UDP-N-acetylglucosamine 2-epimerase [bacterium]|nr:UDP-N-acetylglucosamine 2-epimerase [bacterium]